MQTPVEYLVDKFSKHYAIHQLENEIYKALEMEFFRKQISDEEIEKAFSNASERLSEYKEGLVDGAKWYREQLKTIYDKTNG